MSKCTFLDENAYASRYDKDEQEVRIPEPGRFPHLTFFTSLTSCPALAVRRFVTTLFMLQQGNLVLI